MKKKFLGLLCLSSVSVCAVIGGVIVGKNSMSKGNKEVVFGELISTSQLPTRLLDQTPTNVANELSSQMFMQISEEHDSMKDLRFVIALNSQDMDESVYDVKCEWNVKWYDNEGQLVRSIVADAENVYDIISAADKDVLPSDYGAYTTFATYTIRDIPTASFETTQFVVKATVTGLGGNVGLTNEIGIAYLEEKADAFVAMSSKDLMDYASAWNSGTETKSLKLGANIDLSSELWTPIGTWEYPFNGVVDGDDHVITGLGKGGITPVKTGSTEDIGAFIGVLGGEEENTTTLVKDLTITDAEISLSNGKNCAILVGYAPNNSDFTSRGLPSGIGAGNYQNSLVTIEDVSVDGTVDVNSVGGGIMGKAYTTGRVEILDSTVNADITVKSAQASELIGYVNGTTSMLLQGNTITGTLNYPSGDIYIDDEVVIQTFLEEYIIDSNVSTAKIYLNNVEISDPLKIVNEFNSDNSLKSMNIINDLKDVGQNAITAVHGSDKMTLTLKGGSTANGRNAMSNLATDNVNMVFDGYATKGNVSTQNLVLKGDSVINNSYTTAKKTLLIEAGTYNAVTIDGTGTATMNGGKVTNLTVNTGASLTLNGGQESGITLAKGSSLTTGVNVIEGTSDDYTFKVHVNATGGTGMKTFVNGVEANPGGAAKDLYFKLK